MDTNRYAVPRDDRQEAARAALKTLDVYTMYRGMADAARLYDGVVNTPAPTTPGTRETDPHYRFVTAVEGSRRVVLMERTDGSFIPWSY